jgi:hypothetical protein
MSDFSHEISQGFGWAATVAAMGLFGCAQGHMGDTGAAGSRAGVALPSADNTSAVAAHVARTRATDMAVGTMAMADPTGRVAGPVGAEIKKKAYQASHEKMLDDSMRSLTPEQRTLMKKQMRGEISEEEFRRQMFGTYGLDAEGNPAKAE